MITDVAGRVRNVHLPASRPLAPLFEAISNSIDAIEDAGEREGRISVEVVRDPNSLLQRDSSDAARQLSDIVGFEVRDNGIGLDDRNYEEFQKSDTMYKASRGGKGIGRFVWLAAFDKVEIQSTYNVDGQRKRRRFGFCPREDGIENHSCQDAEREDRETVVRLVGYKEKYRRQCPKRLATIAAHVVEEFLDVFVGSSCPKMTLQDQGSDNKIDLDTFYEDEMVAKSETEPISIKSQPFNILHVRLYTKHMSEHQLCFCAGGRVVTKERLTGIPNLPSRLVGEEDKEFVYASYVNSSVLDQSVNADRTRFDLPQDSMQLLPKEIALADIREGVRDHCKTYLAPYTEPVKQRKRERIQEFLQEDGVMYRPVMRHLEPALDKIEPEATEDDIDRHLYDAYHELQVKLRTEGKDLLAVSESEDAEFGDFKSQFEDFFEKISEVNRANLARYVCHRKAVIEFLDSLLGHRQNGKYQLEERVHSVIFPRGSTSDEVPFDEHNLWLVDERLAFHRYLSSDKPIRDARPLQNQSVNRPDLLVFDKAAAFSETPEAPFTSITIIEFKRPQRTAYGEDDNPFTQIGKYVRNIREGKASFADGRALPIPENLPFYCYVVADMTRQLERWAEDFELQKTPDELGYFGYKRSWGAYCEVISYTKLVADAKKRNRAFFEKLNLPTRVAKKREENGEQSEASSGTQ